MTDEAIAELAPIPGSKRAACRAAGRPQASHYRRHRQSSKPAGPVRDRRPQPRALLPAERASVRAVLNSENFVDKAPATVFHELLDESLYLASVSTMYRILHARNEVRERHRQATHPLFQRQPVQRGAVPHPTDNDRDLTASTSASDTVRGRPGRGSSNNPSSRSATNCDRHVPTVGSDTPSSRDTSMFDMPRAHANTIRARTANA